MKRNTVEFGTSVYITSLFCSGKKMGKLSERNRIVEIRKAQAGEPVAFMGVEDGRLEMLFFIAGGAWSRTWQKPASDGN